MGYIPEFTPAAIRERKTWQFKTLAFCHARPADWGDTGLILIACMGRFKHAPLWHPRGIKIKKDGTVWGLYKPNARFKYAPTLMYHDVAELVADFRTLADESRLEDYERLAMFDELKKWVVEDERVVSPPETFQH